MAFVHISMELNPLPIVPLVLKFGIHQEWAGRKGVRGGEEEGNSVWVESLVSWKFHHLARVGRRM
jgi:hypothetical protein